MLLMWMFEDGVTNIKTSHSYMCEKRRADAVSDGKEEDDGDDDDVHQWFSFRMQSESAHFASETVRSRS